MEQHHESLARAHGTQTIGSNQRTINFTAVSSGGDGLLNITFEENHNLKKGHVINIPEGDYAGAHRIKKVISPTVVQVEGDFGETDSGTADLTAAMDIYGFYVNAVPLTIEELIPYYDYEDAEAAKAATYVPGNWYPLECKLIRLSAGEITVIRKPTPAQLSYTNR